MRLRWRRRLARGARAAAGRSGPDGLSASVPPGCQHATRVVIDERTGGGVATGSPHRPLRKIDATRWRDRRDRPRGGRHRAAGGGRRHGLRRDRAYASSLRRALALRPTARSGDRNTSRRPYQPRSTLPQASCRRGGCVSGRRTTSRSVVAVHPRQGARDNPHTSYFLWHERPTAERGGGGRSAGEPVRRPPHRRSAALRSRRATPADALRRFTAATGRT